MGESVCHQSAMNNLVRAFILKIERPLSLALKSFLVRATTFCALNFLVRALNVSHMRVSFGGGGETRPNSTQNSARQEASQTKQKQTSLIR